MTKKDFVTAFAKKNELKLKEAEKLVSSFLGTCGRITNGRTRC